MFGLTPENLSGKVFDCAAGPASFNAEATRRGIDVTSCDAIYRFEPDEIRTRIHHTFDTLVSNAAARHDEFVWRDILSPEHLGEVRLASMRTFLRDFSQGLIEERYVDGSLPNLQFRDGEFDLALCSHFLFTYTHQLSLGFHVAAIEEMSRVAREVRVFPLLKSYGGLSPHLEPVLKALRAREYHLEIQQVPYEFQRGGNQLPTVARIRN